jgi:ribosomal protein S18 acetylase RimI-like enzyme
MNIIVKQLPGDAQKFMTDKFIDAFLELFNDKDNRIYLSYTNIPFTRESIQNWISQAGQSGVEYYMAYEENGSIAGILTVRFNYIETFEILGLVVGRQYRKKGIGSLLLETAVGKAQEKGFQSVDVAVFADNQNMLSLIIRNDFKPVRMEYRKRFDGEDVVYLKKYL